MGLRGRERKASASVSGGKIKILSHIGRYLLISWSFFLICRSYMVQVVSTLQNMGTGDNK